MILAIAKYLETILRKNTGYKSAMTQMIKAGGQPINDHNLGKIAANMSEKEKQELDAHLFELCSISTVIHRKEKELAPRLEKTFTKLKRIVL